jgi:8-oxo-dGTP pyrophosphatase MutT (NUDIX family)/GNAT superfamily N-acetyltransferase
MIRYATPDDAEALARIRNAAIRSLASASYSEEQIEYWLESFASPGFSLGAPGKVTLLEESDGQAAGFAQLDTETGHVERVYVAPECARRGVASRLLARIEQEARQSGLARVYVEATLNALPFYERAGYSSLQLCDLSLPGGVPFTCMTMVKQLPQGLNREHVQQLLLDYLPHDAVEAAHLERIRELVDSDERFWSREREAGHLTASAWVVAPDNRVLLLHHARLDRWLQPGGHIESSDASLERAALRELVEETGIASDRVLCCGLYDVDVHEIPARGGVPAHWHHDVRFLFRVADPDVTLSDESLDHRWVPVAEILDGGFEPSIVRMARKLGSAG